jgi:hypothetical protein
LESEQELLEERETLALSDILAEALLWIYNLYQLRVLVLRMHLQ